MGMARFALDRFRDDLTACSAPGRRPGPADAPRPPLLAAVAGFATAVLAALVPAIQAASHDPADAVRRTPGGAGGGVAAGRTG